MEPTGGEYRYVLFGFKVLGYLGGEGPCADTVFFLSESERGVLICERRSMLGCSASSKY